MEIKKPVALPAAIIRKEDERTRRPKTQKKIPVVGFSTEEMMRGINGTRNEITELNFGFKGANYSKEGDLDE